MDVNHVAVECAPDGAGLAYEETPPLAISVQVRTHAHPRQPAIYIPNSDASEYLLNFSVPAVSSDAGTVSNGSLYITNPPPKNICVSFVNGETYSFVLISHSFNI